MSSSLHLSQAAQLLLSEAHFSPGSSEQGKYMVSPNMGEKV